MEGIKIEHILFKNEFHDRRGFILITILNVELVDKSEILNTSLSFLIPDPVTSR